MTLTLLIPNRLASSGTNSYVYDGHGRRIIKNKNGAKTYSLYNSAGVLMSTYENNGYTDYYYLGSQLVAKYADPNTQSDEPGYTGHAEDNDLQLTYMQARYYDPVIGRFYSNDPVDFLGHMQRGNPTMGFNRYAYANNNPYKYTDPDGEFGMLVTGLIGGLIGGGVELGKQLYAGKDINLKAIGMEAGKGALVGLGVGAVGGYMALATEGVVTSAIAKVAAESTGKVAGAMAGSLTGDLAAEALGEEVSSADMKANMIGNMVAPGSGDLAAAAVKTMVKSEVIATGSREATGTAISEVAKDKLKE